MQLLRHYFISDDLDDLEAFEEQLEEAGVSTPHIHVLSSDSDEQKVAAHEHLHEVQSLMKTDIIHSTIIGAVVGIVVALILLVIAYFAGWTESAVGWMPFIFLAIVMLGFCTWEGGLRGIQAPNYHFERFQTALSQGKFIFFIDLEPDQEPILEKIFKDHPKVEMARTGSATPDWIIAIQQFANKYWFGDLLRHS
jgi:hypothetical protein